MKATVCSALGCWLASLALAVAMGGEGPGPAYRVTAVVQRARRDDHSVATVKFYSGRARPLTTDDVVVKDGRGARVPHQVIGTGPSTLTCVAFRAGRTQQTFHVYYPERPRGVTGKPAWEPERGLFLQIFRKAHHNPCRNFQQFKAILGRSTESMGGDAWPTPCLVENPFGSDDEFVSVFRGHFYAQKAGRYQFAITSDEASFLFVDGAEVVAFPGWHRMDRACKRAGAIELKTGWHRLEYYHVEHRGPQGAWVMWHRPGDPKDARYGPKYQNMSPEIFRGALATKTVRVEKAGEPIVAGFDVQRVARMQVRGLDVLIIGLTAWQVPGARDDSFTWRLPDGIVAKGRKVGHMLFSHKPIKVVQELSVAEHHDVFQRVIDLDDPVVSAVEEPDAERLIEEALERTCESDTSSADPGTRAGLLRLLKWYGKRSLVSAQCTEAFSAWQQRRGAVRGLPEAQLLVSVASELRRHGEVQSARKLSYSLADAKAVRDPALVCRAAVEAALCARLSGDDEKAERHRNAAEDAALRMRASSVEARRGALYHKIRHYTHQKQYDQALAAIGDLEDAIPLELLEGNTILARLEVLMKQKDYRQAIREFEALEKIRPALAHSASTLRLAVLAYKKTRDDERVRSLQERLKTWETPRSSK